MGMINKKTITINFFAILILVIGVYFLSDIAKENEQIQYFILNYGYIGLFSTSIISGFNLLVPIPIITFLPLIVLSGLNPWIAVLIISIGMTIGDGAGFLLGRTGRSVIDQNKLPKFLRNCEGYFHNHPKFIPFFLFFYASFVPFPNELVVIPIALFERPWWHIMGPVLAGNIVFNITITLGFMTIPGLL